MTMYLCVCLAVGITTAPVVFGSTYSDATNLITTLTTGYNRYVRPTLNQSAPTYIEVYLTLKSLTSLDEVNGVLTTVVALNIMWTDENLQWIPANHGGIDQIKMDEKLIWVPYFITSNPANDNQKLGHDNIQATVYSSGYVDFSIGEYLQTTCDVDVTYFPFDTQTCIIELMPFGYSTHYVFLAPQPVSTDIYSENNVWILKSTSSESASFGDSPYVKFSISLERRYAFFILNLFSPVLILALLNAMVFLLPSDSGERVGYAITCLLSLSVYMTFASENLPTSSKPIPVIIYVLLVYIVISVLMCLETIISLRFHLRDDSTSPPKFLREFCFRPWDKCKNRRTVHTVDAELQETKELPKEEEEEERYTWKQFAQTFDTLCFISNVVFVIILSFVYLIVVIKGS